MSKGQIISGIILLLSAGVMFFYISFTARKKGPIFTNTYLLFSEEERQKMNIDKDAEYRLVTVICSLIGAALIMGAIYAFSDRNLFFALSIACLVAAVIYAVYSAIKANHRSK